MPQFRPSVSIERNSRNEHMMPYEKDGYHRQNQKYFQYLTYRKLKSDLKRLMKEWSVTEAYVSRSRRGEWGEWFEYWHLSGNKLVLGKHGWM